VPGASRAPTPLARLSRLTTTLSYYRRAIATLRRWRPRILHCNDYNTMWVGVAAKLLWGAAVVYDSHELWPDRNGRSEPRAWLLACEALFVRMADQVLTTSPAHAEAIAARYRRPAPIVVRNVSDRSVDGERPSELPRNSIVYAGAVTTGRGLEQAIEALPNAAGVGLEVLGPGREQFRRGLLALAESAGVADRFELAPAVPPAELIPRIAGAAAGLALIQPICRSYELSLPNKLFDYLAAGLPVLASDLPEIGRFVADSGLGLVVPPTDTDAIAAAMLELTDPVRSRTFRRAVTEARAELSWERERARLVDVHRAALATAGT
jgi:glycosyltransferase involved in cell wall biosynthesis